MVLPEIVVPATFAAAVEGPRWAVTGERRGLARSITNSERWRQTLDCSYLMTFEQALAFEGHAQAVLLGSEDLVEGAAAFIEQRSLGFKGQIGDIEAGEAGLFSDTTCHTGVICWVHVLISCLMCPA